jgi:hypothetical protein
MNPKALKALKASIHHWRENVAAERPEGVALGPDYCALCRAFQLPFSADSDRVFPCNGCPVKMRTGRERCNGTPYEAAEDAHTAWYVTEGHYERDGWREVAQAELDFLISLLPEGETA